MKLHRIWAIILRFLYHFRHSFDRWVDVFYWPLLDLLLWGLTGLYFVSFSPDIPKVLVAILAGIILWLVVYRGQYEISGNLLEDVWNKNLINIFVSPLKLSEWTTSFFIIGVMKSLLGLGFAMALAFVLYKVKIFMFGIYLIPFVGLLILTGWWIGCLIAGLILRYGTRIQAFAWTAVWAISPFCGIYYPLAILPQWAETVAKFVPASYVFEGVRELIKTGTVDSSKLIISLLLNIVYCILALIFLRRSFSAILKKGLVKVH